jgi:hypothetical protein
MRRAREASFADERFVDPATVIAALEEKQYTLGPRYLRVLH